MVHTICYSVLLLNTDLHLADIEQKMTRSQFIKNTMPTIRRVVEDAAPDAFEPAHHHRSPAPRSRNSSTDPMCPVGAKLLGEAELRPSTDVDRPVRGGSRRGRSPTPLGSDPTADEGCLLVTSPFRGTRKAWEGQVELVLKDIFNAIRRQQLPLGGSAAAGRSETVEADTLPFSDKLSVRPANGLKRTPSTVSKALAESNGGPPRGRSELQRLGSHGRWASKTRARPRPYPSSTVASSRTSLDDRSSIWTPTNPSAWSKYSLNKTQTSTSVASVGSQTGPAAYRQSIGFANALGQVMIREDDATRSMTADERVTPLLEDETLGLAGAPWAKEGRVYQKCHRESAERRCKDRNWSECFAVVSQGYLRLFSFSKGSLRPKNNRHLQAGAVVGGGNWAENADAIGSFLLRQTIASELPSPGYSKARPYVWALSFPTGAVHLFQVGTPEIVQEWVSTANYWSARLSKEPVVGGISNIEYGWSEALVNQGWWSSSGESQGLRRPRSNSGARPSLQGSIRPSSFDHTGPLSSRSRLPGDKAIISEWNPPQQSMVASRLGEADQLQVPLSVHLLPPRSFSYVTLGGC